MNIIDGHKLAEDIRYDLRHKIVDERMQPGLAIILVGDDEASHKYVALKKKASEEIGIAFHLYKFPYDVQPHDVEQTIDFLNEDPDTDGIIIQLPLPHHLDADNLVNRIRPDKDADGFHKENIKAFLAAGERAHPPVLVESIMRLLGQTNKDMRGKTALILANSSVFPLAMTEALERQNMYVRTLIRPTHNRVQELKEADVIIVLLGKKLFIEAGNTKENAIIIDAGYTLDNGESLGDVNMQSFQDTDVWITPVPGGVGPMTVAMLLHRTVQLYEEHHKL